MNKALYALLYQTSLATTKNNEQLFVQLKTLFSTKHELVLNPIALYWMSKYHKEKKLFEQHKHQSSAVQPQLLLQI